MCWRFNINYAFEELNHRHLSVVHQSNVAYTIDFFARYICLGRLNFALTKLNIQLSSIVSYYLTITLRLLLI